MQRDILRENQKYRERICPPFDSNYDKPRPKYKISKRKQRELERQEIEELGSGIREIKRDIEWLIRNT